MIYNFLTKTFSTGRQLDGYSDLCEEASNFFLKVPNVASLTNLNNRLRFSPDAPTLATAEARITLTAYDANDEVMPAEM